MPAYTGQLEQMRASLLHLYQAALEAVSGRKAVARAARQQSWPSQLYVVAIGKAAAAMLQGLYDAQAPVAQALLITKYNHAETLRLRPEITLFEAGHPLPDENSFRAGQALLQFVQTAPADCEFLFLLSGGASSVVEVPAEGVSPACIRSMTQHYMTHGEDIVSLNRMRNALSQIKGGGLCRYLRGRHTRQWLISDVPDDDPAIIGSGLLVPQAGQVNWPRPRPHDCRAVGLAAREQGACDGLRETRIVARLADALHAVVHAAQQYDWPVRLMEQRLQGEAALAADHIAQQLLNGPPGLLVYGGETTVSLPGQPGRGGRCQHLALAAALRLRGRSNVALLAAASDGDDGPGVDADEEAGVDAGAVVDGWTCERAAQQGYPAQTALAQADSGTALQAAGDLIQTGPTGSNVTDLVLALKWH